MYSLMVHIILLIIIVTNSGQRVAGDRRVRGIEEGRSWEQQQHDGGRRASEIGC